VDTQTTSFGIREFHFDPATGFWLNGKNFKLFGCCLHQDAGALGIAAPIGVWKQRLEELRSIGCNAIRTSHNPPDPAFLDLCDRMGFLVMDEMFDVWTVGKTPLLSRQTLNDYHLYYRDWWRADVTNTVLRDRNHPCVILYSAGNEIHDIRANSDLGFQIFRPLRDLYHQLDPTRPVTLALLRPNQTGVYKNGFADLLDVVGQNYRENELVAAHAEHPQWKIIGTENHLDPEAWDYLRDTPAYSGQFIWTGFDYLGESIGWPTVGSGSGLFDRTGLAKPQAYQAQSWWTHKPMVYVARVVAVPRLDLPPAELGMDMGPRIRSRLVSDWTERVAGRMERVQVFTNCQNVELLLDNKSLGVQDRSADDEPLEWNVPFAAGTLKAVARNEGKVAVTYELRTAGPAAAVKLVTDRNAIRAGDDDAIYIRARVVDKDGTVVPDANNLIAFTLNGPGKIVAVDSADNTCHDPFRASQRHAYQGQCVAIVEGTSAGKIVVNSTANGLSPSRATIQINP
jgi:beta-galactosidase